MVVEKGMWVGDYVAGCVPVSLERKCDVHNPRSSFEGQLEHNRGSGSLLQPVSKFTYFGNLPLSGPPLSHFCNGTPQNL